MSLSPRLGVPVLMYHWVHPQLGDRLRLYGVTPRAFERQMRYLHAAGYRVLSLDELRRVLAGGLELDRPCAVLTFDDGYVDNLEHAGPILESLGFSATIFVVTDHAGGVNAWDLRHGDPPRPLLDWASIRRADGRTFRFEPHSRSHPDLTTVPLDRAREEIHGSKRRLEDELGREAGVFSYPHGAFNVPLERIVTDAGFRMAVTDLWGLNRPGGNPLRIRRTMVTSRDVFPTYAVKVITGFGAYALRDDLWRRLRRRPAAWEGS